MVYVILIGGAYKSPESIPQLQIGILLQKYEVQIGAVSSYFLRGITSWVTAAILWASQLARQSRSAGGGVL